VCFNTYEDMGSSPISSTIKMNKVLEHMEKNSNITGLPIWGQMDSTYEIKPLYVVKKNKFGDSEKITYIYVTKAEKQ